jgi:cryptochrome
MSFCLLIGFDTDGLLPPVWKGGESEALGRLERHLERKAWVASFGRPKMTPQSLLASQTGLSPYLRFGCLSTRLFYYQLTDLYKKVCTAVNFSYSSHQFYSHGTVHH